MTAQTIEILEKRKADHYWDIRPIYTKKWIESDNVEVTSHFSNTLESLISQTLHETMAMLDEFKLPTAEYFKVLCWAASQQKTLWQKQLEADRKEGWMIV
jgi:hypothetical protein